MKTILLAGCLIAFGTSSIAQTMQEIGKLFAQKRYEEVLAQAEALRAKEPLNAFAYEITGTVYFVESKYDSSIPYLQKAISIDNDSTYISGSAHGTLGTVYIHLGDKDRGIAELNRCVELGMSPNREKAAKHLLDSLGYEVKVKTYSDDYLPDWVMIDRPDITYYFQDTIGLTNATYKYVRDHDEAYITLNKVFEAKLPKKMVIYVWNDKEIAQKILHKPLGFTKPRNCISYAHRNQSIGHEMTHTLSYWAWGSEQQDGSRFITEGIAVCFDLSTGDKYALARRVIEKARETDVLKIWKKEGKYDEDVLYPVAGAFVQYLYEHSTKEEFKAAVKGQTLENVKAAYGDKFAGMVTGFNHLMGIK